MACGVDTSAVRGVPTKSHRTTISGEYYFKNEEGTYKCVCCDTGGHKPAVTASAIGLSQGSHSLASIYEIGR